MNDIQNLDVFKSKFISGVVESFKTDPSQYKGSSFAPLRNTTENEIVIDVREYYDGLIPAVSPGAESPVVSRESRAQMKYKPAFFRGKMLLTEGNFEQLRRLGTANQKETRQEMVAGWMSDLDRQVELRIEHARWATLVNGKYAYNIDGQDAVVNYNVPDKFKPVLSGTDKWSDLSNSDPVSDLLDWSRLFRGTPARMGGIWINRKVLTWMLQNAKVRDLIKTFSARAGIGQPTVGMLEDVLKAEISGFEAINIYDEGWNVKSFVTVNADAGQKDIAVEAVTHIEVGDTITIKTADYTKQEDAVVASISGKTITLVDNLSNDFVVGDDIVVFKPFIPDNKVILKGVVPNGQMDMSFISTPSPYNGGLMNPKPGKFGKSIPTEADPPKIELVAGVYGLPIMRNDTNVVADI